MFYLSTSLKFLFCIMLFIASFPFFAFAQDPDKIFLHIRAQQGIPFPSTEEIKKLEEYRDPDPKEVERAYDKLIREPMKEMQKVKKLPDCTESKTEKIKWAEPSGEKAIVYSDMLFLKEGAMPEDSEKVFGTGVVVSEYKESKPDALTMGAQAYGLTCLPSRDRVTSEFIFRYTGRDALKNYSEDVHESK